MVKYNDHISNYITDLFADRENEFQKIKEESEKRGMPTISIKPEEGRFLQFLVRSCSAEKAVEIGTLGGYSGIWIARGLAPGGKLVTLEKDLHHAVLAREHFQTAGISDLVEVRVGDAHSLLSDLSDEGPFDFVFIDADKVGYNFYFSWGVQNTHPGGVIAAHNALRGFNSSGRYMNDINNQTILTLNRRVASDPRLISTIFPAGDGMLVAVKIA